jgi:hypothetical protein
MAMGQQGTGPLGQEQQEQQGAMTMATAINGSLPLRSIVCVWTCGCGARQHDRLLFRVLFEKV